MNDEFWIWLWSMPDYIGPVKPYPGWLAVLMFYAILLLPLKALEWIDKKRK